MRVTPDLIEATFEYLKAFPPFKGWNLPHADEVEFGVFRKDDRWGDYELCKDSSGVRCRHRIRVGYKVTSTLLLQCTMAHEMIHMRQAILYGWGGVNHTETFEVLAKQVRKHHDFILSLQVA
jgi:hypothetical protein